MATAEADGAEAAGLEVTEIAERDADVPLSPTGETQARALGTMLPELRPDVVISSPYRRAAQTASLMVNGAAPVRLDEPLPEPALGILDPLPPPGVAGPHPHQAVRPAPRRA